MSHAVVDLFSHVVIFVMRQSPTHKELGVMRRSTVTFGVTVSYLLTEFKFLVTKCGEILPKDLQPGVLQRDLRRKLCSYSVIRERNSLFLALLVSLIDKGHFIDP